MLGVDDHAIGIDKTGISCPLWPLIRQRALVGLGAFAPVAPLNRKPRRWCGANLNLWMAPSRILSRRLAFKSMRFIASANDTNFCPLR